LDTQSEFGAEENSSASENQITATLEKILDLQNKNSRQLVQSLRENVNFQNQVRQGMQRELDNLKELQRGEQFTPILKSIAAVCVEYRKILADEMLPKRRPGVMRNGRPLYREFVDVYVYDANAAAPVKKSESVRSE